MKILSVDKDKVQVELTRGEMEYMAYRLWGEDHHDLDADINAEFDAILDKMGGESYSDVLDEAGKIFDTPEARRMLGI